MAIGRDGKEIVVGSIKYIWDNEEKVHEYEERIKKAKIEIRNLPKGRRHITFLSKRGYKKTLPLLDLEKFDAFMDSEIKKTVNYPLNTKILYKETVVGFRADGFVQYKPHSLTIKQGRIVTSNADEIAFLDMNGGYIRETDRPLTQAEQTMKDKIALEKKVAKLEQTIDDKGIVEEPPDTRSALQKAQDKKRENYEERQKEKEKVKNADTRT